MADSYTENKELADGGLDEGIASVRGIKRKLHMSEEITYEQGFEQYDVHKVKVTGGVLNKGDLLDFEFASWSDCIRLFNGQFVIDVQFKKNDGSDFPADVTQFGKDNAWVRPNFFHNLFEHVYVIINGQTLERHL